MTVPFIEENDQTRARREHLEALRALVGNVYPNKFERSNVTGTPSGEDTITSVLEKFKSFEPNAEPGQKPSTEAIEISNLNLNQVRVRLAGRIASPPRVMGKAAFAHLSDGTSRLQIYVRREDVVGVRNDADGGDVDGWALFSLLDHGDFIGVEGFLFVTKTGELSVHVEKLQFLAKALLPMPDKMHGIHDPEIRQRQRYADLIAGSLKLEPGVGSQESGQRELNPRQVFELRSRVIKEIRRFLDDRDFVEVETPMLTPLATGAAARPFKTHHNALDIDLYARIAPELYLKRLVVGGFEKVYELNRNFRNEGISTKHNPEFTMLEFYWAYADVNQMMDLCEELLRSVVYTVTGHTHVRYGDYPPIDFSQPFQRMTMKEAIVKYWPTRWRDLGVETVNLDWLSDPVRIAQLHNFFPGAEYRLSEVLGHIPQSERKQSIDEIARQVKDEVWGVVKDGRMVTAMSEAIIKMSQEDRSAFFIESLFGWVAEQFLVNPTFIVEFPKIISPLSKASPADPTVAERFEFFVGALETANGFSELNDPEEQYQRFRDQVQQRERGYEEAMPMDEDYIRALSYGMPPAAGIGVGIDRLVMLLGNKHSIRDVILFPHMRPERTEGSRQEADGRNEEAGQ